MQNVAGPAHNSQAGIANSYWLSGGDPLFFWGGGGGLAVQRLVLHVVSLASTLCLSCAASCSTGVNSVSVSKAAVLPSARPAIPSLALPGWHQRRGSSRRPHQDWQEQGRPSTHPAPVQPFATCDLESVRACAGRRCWRQETVSDTLVLNAGCSTRAPRTAAQPPEASSLSVASNHLGHLPARPLSPPRWRPDASPRLVGHRFGSVTPTSAGGKVGRASRLGDQRLERLARDAPWWMDPPPSMREGLQKQQALATCSSPANYQRRMEARGQDLPVIAWSPGLGDPADQQRRLLRYSRQSNERRPALVCAGGPRSDPAASASGKENRRIPAVAALGPPDGTPTPPLGFSYYSNRLLAPRIAIASRPPRSAAEAQNDALALAACGGGARRLVGTEIGNGDTLADQDRHNKRRQIALGIGLINIFQLGGATVFPLPASWRFGRPFRFVFPESSKLNKHGHPL